MRRAPQNFSQIEWRRLDELKPYGPAARLHSKAQLRKLTALLERHDQVTPVIIDAANGIIDGHLVVETLKAMGRDQVMVLVAASRDEAEIKAIRLALNRIPQDSKWNNAKLKDEFEALLQLGYDLDLTGFDAVEIDTAFAIDDPGVGGTEDLPAAPAHDAAPVSQAGDLILLDRHRLVCGDARDSNAIARLMAGEVARMAFLDVPYNVPIGGFVTKGPHREFAMASGEMSNGEFRGFLEQALTAASSALCDGAIMYTCIDWRGLMPLSAAAVLAGLTQLNLCVWAKTNAGLGSFYRSQHELVPVFKKGSAPHLNNFELGQKGRSRSNIWTYKGMNAFGQERDDLLAAHPTVKPVALVRDAIKDVSRRADIVLDTFLGSGTTLIAADETGRRCFGVELDPLYVDVVVRRWQAHTGKAAIFADTGQAFDDRDAAMAAPALSRPILRLTATDDRAEPS
jgi:DNA modification methylase